MVLALAGDSTITRRPRPTAGLRGEVVVFVDFRATVVAARRRVADVCSGIARFVLHVIRAVQIDCGVQDDG